MGFYEELYHAKSGYERKNHKWVTRTGTPGHYVYTYEKEGDVDPRMNGGQSSQNLSRNTQRYITPQSGPSTSYQQSLSRLRSRIEGNARVLRPSRQLSTSEPREPRAVAPSQNGSAKSGGSSKSSSGSSSRKQRNTTQTRASSKTSDQLAEAGKKWLEGAFSDKLSEDDAKKLRIRLGAMRLERLGIYRR